MNETEIEVNEESQFMETEQNETNTENSETDSEQDKEQGQEEADRQTQEPVILLDTSVAESVEVIKEEMLQLVQSVETIRYSMASMVFLILFVWAERKIKNAIMKMSGGKKNANID